MALVTTEVASAAGHTIVLRVQYDNVTGAISQLQVDNGQPYPVTATVIWQSTPHSQTFPSGIGQVYDLTPYGISLTIQKNGDVSWPQISLSN